MKQKKADSVQNAVKDQNGSNQATYIDVQSRSWVKISIMILLLCFQAKANISMLTNTRQLTLLSTEGKHQILARFVFTAGLKCLPN